jgi:hypothetical protein
MKGSEKPSPEGSLEVMNRKVRYVALYSSDSEGPMSHFRDATEPCRCKAGAGSSLVFAVNPLPFGIRREHCNDG